MGKEKRYYWLKLKEDFFSQKEIKRLRRIAGGDTYTIIYLKMLLKSLRTDGYLYFEGIESDFISELALDIDEDEDNVEVTVNYLKNKGILIEKSEDEYFLTTCKQMTGSESGAAERVRKHRAKQDEKLLQSNAYNTSRENCNIQALHCNAQTLQCNSNVTKCNTEIEIDRDKDKDKEIEKEKEVDREKEEEIEKEKEVDREKEEEIEKIKSLFVANCPSYVNYLTKSSITDTTRQAILASLQVYSIDDFKTMFQKAEKSSFLKGQNKQKWKAVFGWLVKTENIQKILSGAYDDDKWTVLNRMCQKANENGG